MTLFGINTYLINPSLQRLQVLIDKRTENEGHHVNKNYSFHNPSCF